MDGKGQRSTSPEKVKNNIFCLMRLKGLSEVESAKNAGVASGYFSWMKKSTGYPDLQKLLNICDALNTPIEDVLYKDWTAALDQAEVNEIDKEIARLKKRRDALTNAIVKRAKERAAEQDAAEQEATT